MHWIQSSAIYQARAVRDSLHSIPQVRMISEPSSKQLYRILQRQAPDSSLRDMIGARLEKWSLVPALPPSAPALVVARLRTFSRKVKHGIVFHLIGTICNGWHTSARFSSNILPCRFCGSVGGDKVQHYLECPTVLSFVNELTLFQWAPDGPPMFVKKWWLAVHPNHTLNSLIQAALVNEAVWGVFQHARTSQVVYPTAQWISHFRSRLRAIARLDSRVRHFIHEMLRLVRCASQSRCIPPPASQS